MMDQKLDFYIDRRWIYANSTNTKVFAIFNNQPDMKLYLSFNLSLQNLWKKTEKINALCDYLVIEAPP